MIGSISPVVYGPPKKLRWLSIWLWYAVGATLSAWLWGWILVGINKVLFNFSDGFSFWWLLAGLSFLCGLHEFGLLKLPAPQCRRQVPARWRVHYPPWIYSALYGAILGPGLFTYIPTALYYVMIGSSVLSGRDAPGVMAVFGLSQVAPALIAGLFTNNIQELSKVSIGYMRYQTVLHYCAGCLLVAFGTYLTWR
jgi:hypothetical protein